MRALAVYLVVAFHAGLSRFRGGFIGVDVFFVLSGYLVTQVLLRDLEGRGGIRFGRFYSRRVRRLLPASLVAIATTAAFYTAVAGPAQVAQAVGAFKASFLYVVNWYFIDQATDYFAGDTAQSPVLHLWSLAVEEQFYLLWPLLFAALAWATSRLARHRTAAQRSAIAVAMMASAGWALFLRDSQPERAYFGTDARAYQLLAGALLALSPALIERATRSRRLTQLAGPMALLGIGVLAVRLHRLDPIERGVAVTVATVLLIVAIEADVGGPVRWMLSRPPLVYLGQISYATYLWHWPVIIIIAQVVEVSPRPLAVITALVATGLASLSYHLLEQPVRISATLDRFRWPVAGIGVAMSVLAAVILVPALTDRGTSDDVAVAAAAGGEFTPVPDTIDPAAVYFERFGETVDCVGQPAENCTVVEGDGAHLLLMGDSNAQAWIPAFTAMAEQENLTLSLAVTAGCLWQRDAYKLSQEIIDACRRAKTDAYDRVIPELDPDLIVVANAREPKGPANPVYVEDRFNEVLRRSTPESIETLGAGGRPILIIEPLPTPVVDDFDPRDCLTDAEVLEDCRFVADTTISWHVELERELARSSETVYTADFSRLACPFLPICDPVIDDIVVWWNNGHLTTRYSETLGPEVGTFLKEQGLIAS